MYYLDPLYGQKEISNKEFSLFQTKALTRLRDVSLSAVLPLALPSGMVASRFEHSVGVAFLTKKLCQKKPFSKIKDNLYLAALLHDIGSPPFSHLSDFSLHPPVSGGVPRPRSQGNDCLLGRENIVIPSDDGRGVAIY